MSVLQNFEDLMKLIIGLLTSLKKKIVYGDQVESYHDYSWVIIFSRLGKIVDQTQEDALNIVSSVPLCII